MATQSQLIAHRLSVPEIQQRVGADSLMYLSLAGMLQAVTGSVSDNDSPSPTHCHACFSGNYPLDIPEWLFHEEREKIVLEDVAGA